MVRNRLKFERNFMKWLGGRRREVNLTLTALFSKIEVAADRDTKKWLRGTVYITGESNCR